MSHCLSRGKEHSDLDLPRNQSAGSSNDDDPIGHGPGSKRILDAILSNGAMELDLLRDQEMTTASSMDNFPRKTDGTLNVERDPPTISRK